MKIIAGAMAAASAVAAVTSVATRGDTGLRRRIDAMAEGYTSRTEGPLRWIRGRLSAAKWVRRLPLPERVPAVLTTTWSLGTDEFRAVKLVAAAAGLVLALGAAALIPPLAVVAPLVGLVAYRSPDFVLARAARRRRQLADAALPQFLDLLAAASTAGLGPHAGLRQAAGATSGPLRGELERFLDAVNLGARWRDQLAELAERLGLSDLKRAVHAMVRTERLGSSLAEALRELADDVREERRSRTTEAARKAPVKMLFPLVFMVLPAFLLLTVVPVLIATLRSIR